MIYFVFNAIIFLCQVVWWCCLWFSSSCSRWKDTQTSDVSRFHVKGAIKAEESLLSQWTVQLTSFLKTEMLLVSPTSVRLLFMLFVHFLVANLWLKKIPLRILQLYTKNFFSYLKTVLPHLLPLGRAVTACQF